MKTANKNKGGKQTNKTKTKLSQTAREDNQESICLQVSPVTLISYAALFYLFYIIISPFCISILFFYFNALQTISDLEL